MVLMVANKFYKIEFSAKKHTEGLPKLNKLPFLRWLFGQQKQGKSDYEIWILIKPSILKKH